jgi:predicted AlkP superfamily phosphohydrolase/phosphomutase
MLALLHVDAVNVSLLERLTDEGRMPVFDELRRRGRWHALETPATHFPASTYFSLHSGYPPGDHGHHFSFQWSASEQRLRYRRHFGAPTTVCDRLTAVGKRTLLIDPYELAPPAQLDGRALSGWQFANSLSLERWAVPRSWQRPFERRLGRGPAMQEVFGRRNAGSLFSMRQTLLSASDRAAELTVDVLRRERFDFVYVSLLAAHQAGHIFWDVSQLEVNDAQRAKLEGTLPLIYEQTDQALGRIVGALPSDADVIVVSPLGMGPNTSRVDFLAEMLELVLASSAADGSGALAEAGDRIWRLRAAVPTPVRSAVARAMGPNLAREVTARLSTSGIDWSNIRAFMLPSDENGLIRLNLSGRERDGIVDPGEADSLLRQIAEGLLTFHDLDGGPSIKAVDRAAEIFPGRRSDLLPDLVVRWAQTPSTGIKGVRSERYGEIRRRPAGGTGRNGSHTAEAFALVVPGPSQERTPGRPARVTDIGPTICAVLGANGDVPDGELLLEPRA